MLFFPHQHIPQTLLQLTDIPRPDIAGAEMVQNPTLNFTREQLGIFAYDTTRNEDQQFS